MERKQTLDTLNVGETARLREIATHGAMRRRLLDLGMSPGTVVECVGKSPLGDPAAYLIRGAVIALRQRDCRLISVIREEVSEHEA